MQIVSQTERLTTNLYNCLAFLGLSCFTIGHVLLAIQWQVTIFGAWTWLLKQSSFPMRITGRHEMLTKMFNEAYMISMEYSDYTRHMNVAPISVWLSMRCDFCIFLLAFFHVSCKSQLWQCHSVLFTLAIKTAHCLHASQWSRHGPLRYCWARQISLVAIPTQLQTWT